jgi:hypothetical protein
VSSYLDRLLVAAAKRRGLDEVALRAVFKATRLLGLSLAQRLREYRDHGDPVLDRFARGEEGALHLGLLREALDVLARRWDKLPERQRPHYSPQDRFRILRIRTLLALSADETARVFRVSTGTDRRPRSTDGRLARQARSARSPLCRRRPPGRPVPHARRLPRRWLRRRSPRPCRMADLASLGPADST